MPLSTARYTSDGKIDVFQIPFPLAQAAEVVVTIDGITVTTEYFSHNNTIKLKTVPKQGSKIVICRKTAIKELAGKILPGAINNDVLTKNAEQALHKLQELDEAFSGALMPTAAGVFDANGLRLTNLGNPTQDTDAVHKAFVDSLLAKKEEIFNKLLKDVETQVKLHKDIDKNITLSAGVAETKVYDLLEKMDQKTRSISTIETRFTEAGIKAVTDAFTHTGQVKALSEEIVAKSTAFDTRAQKINDDLGQAKKAALDALESITTRAKGEAQAFFTVTETRLKEYGSAKETALVELHAKTKTFHDTVQDSAQKIDTLYKQFTAESKKSLEDYGQKVEGSLTQIQAALNKQQDTLSSDLKTAKDDIVKTRLDSVAEIAELTGRHRELLRTCETQADQSRKSIESALVQGQSLKEEAQKLIISFNQEHLQKHTEMFEVLGSVKAQAEAVQATLKQVEALKTELIASQADWKREAKAFIDQQTKVAEESIIKLLKTEQANGLKVIEEATQKALKEIATFSKASASAPIPQPSHDEE